MTSEEQAKWEEQMDGEGVDELMRQAIKDEFTDRMSHFDNETEVEVDDWLTGRKMVLTERDAFSFIVAIAKTFGFSGVMQTVHDFQEGVNEILEMNGRSHMMNYRGVALDALHEELNESMFWGDVEVDQMWMRMKLALAAVETGYIPMDQEGVLNSAADFIKSLLEKFYARMEEVEVKEQDDESTWGGFTPWQVVVEGADGGVRAQQLAKELPVLAQSYDIELDETRLTEDMEYLFDSLCLIMSNVHEITPEQVARIYKENEL